MKESVLCFFRNNQTVIIGLILGCVLGYFYWVKFGMLWGTYPLSSEWWVNCTYGTLVGGLIASLLSKKQYE